MTPTVPFRESQQPVFMPAPRAIEAHAVRDRPTPANAKEAVDGPRSFRETMQRTIKKDEGRSDAPARKPKARRESNSESSAASSEQQSQADVQALRDAAAWMAGAQQAAVTPVRTDASAVNNTLDGDAVEASAAADAPVEGNGAGADGSAAGAGAARTQGVRQATATAAATAGTNVAQAARGLFAAELDAAVLGDAANVEVTPVTGAAAAPVVTVMTDEVATPAEGAPLAETIEAPQATSEQARVTPQAFNGDSTAQVSESAVALSRETVSAPVTGQGVQVQEVAAHQKNADAPVVQPTPHAPVAAGGAPGADRPAVLRAEAPATERSEATTAADTAFVTPAALALSQASPDLAASRAGLAGVSAAPPVDYAALPEGRLQPDVDLLVTEVPSQGQADGRASGDASPEGQAEMGTQQQSSGRAALDASTPQSGVASSNFSSTVQQVSSAPRVAPAQAVPPTPPAPWEVGTPSVRLDMLSDEGLPVQVHVSLVHQTVYARVVTPQAEMQDFLTRNQSKLETQLQQQGLEMGSFVVDSGQQQSQQAWEQWQAREGSRGMGRASQERGGAETRDAGGPAATTGEGRRSRLHIVA